MSLQKISPELAAKIREALDDGQRVEWIAERLKVAKSVVYKVERTPRTKSRRTVQPFDRLRPELVSMIRTLHRQKLSQRLIALEVGVSQATVSRAIAQDRAAMTAPLSPRAVSLEIVDVQTIPRREAEAGRSYTLFPLKQRSA